MTTLTVYRNGTFEVAAPEIEGKCGAEGKKLFKFEAWVTATPADLDARGFIVDNADLARWFRNVFGPPGEFVSCERICTQTIDAWQAMWPFATAIKVRVWGLEDVTYVEASWEPPPKVYIQSSSLRGQWDALRQAALGGYY